MISQLLTASEQRRQAYCALSDPVRDLAISYRVEAEACRMVGDKKAAGQAMAKYQRQLTAYLEAKKAIRTAYPGDDGDPENGTGPLYFVGLSGVCHTAECGFAKGNGEWASAEELLAHGTAVRPCLRCHPEIGV